jgi:diamine N-acetyltransferase
MDEFIYICGGIELFDSVRVLWERLNRHHAAVSVHFADRFKAGTFENRRKQLGIRAESGFLRVDICYDGRKRPVGFCAASILGSEGEIESLFVLSTHRGRGIGETLMERAMEWFNSNGSETVKVSAVFGNEAAHGFYAKFGLFPRTTVLISKGTHGNRSGKSTGG